MSARKVLDSYSLIAYLENEPGAEKVSALIKQARDRDKRLLLSVVNWGEVYYIARRAEGQEAADRVMQSLDTLPIELVDVDRELTRIAAEFKATRKMSYADCFAAALAKLRNAELVTGDKEFREVEGAVHIRWI